MKKLSIEFLRRDEKRQIFLLRIQAVLEGASSGSGHAMQQIRSEARADFLFSAERLVHSSIEECRSIHASGHAFAQRTDCELHVHGLEYQKSMTRMVL
jgi:hypothetical protein